jgi:beta-glucosidase
MCAACHERGLAPIVTFHHFTTPRWVAARGGWIEPETAVRFGRMCARAAQHLGDLLTRACTINEPNIVARIGYEAGIFPPGMRDAGLRDRATAGLTAGHRAAIAAIREHAPGVPVGLTLAMQDYQAVDGGEAARDRERAIMEDVFLAATAGDDFIGVQTYTRQRVGPDGLRGPAPGVPLTQMGYEVWPEALAACIRRAVDVTGLPVLVTENGIGIDDDRVRIAFVRRALEGVLACLADGIRVDGYVYWSLLDNFEWALGYGPTFGLVAVDRTNQERRPKPSAAWLGAVARANALAPRDRDGA